jgi:hypothetical protein
MINMLLNFVLLFLGILIISMERPQNFKVVDLVVSYNFSLKKYLHLVIMLLKFLYYFLVHLNNLKYKNWKL